MRILWLTVDRSHRVAHHFDDFRKTVSELPEIDIVTLFKKPAGSNGQNMWQLSRNLINGEVKTENIIKPYLNSDSDFDFIFCDAFFAYMDEDWNTGIPSSIFIEDVHQEVPKAQIEKAKELGIGTIFHRFNHAFHKFHQEAKFDFTCIWLPHSIRLDRYNNYFSKSIDVLHVGVHPEKYYPNRHHVVNTLKEKSYFKLVERPKEAINTDRSSRWPIDKDYDELLQKSKIVITGGSIFNAPVQKYVEIPAANSLLMSNWFPDLGMLGFVPGRNIVTYTRDNVVEVVEELLGDESKIRRISDNGYNLMILNHTSDIRAKQFINFICQIIKQPKIYNIINPCSFQVNFKPRQKQVKETTVKSQNPKPKVVTGTGWRSRILRNMPERENNRCIM